MQNVYENPYSFHPDRYQKEADLMLSKFLAKTAKVLFVIGILIFLGSFAPSVWYYLKSGGAPEAISKLLALTVKKDQVTQAPVKPQYQPKLDPSLPRENRIKIPKAKIDTLIYEAVSENYEEALQKGVWRVPDFGTPADRDKPLILAAHRFGYLKWSIPYRLKNSFYNLPKLKEGDTVEIIWRQRKYIYKVYKEAEGEEITDYSADLILYTCENLSSPVRIFRYAKLLEI